MIAALIGTVFAFAGAPQDVETMSVRPMSEAEAVSEFENACVLGIRDPAKVSDSAAHSAHGYVEGRALSDTVGKTRNWSSRYGSLQYIDRGAIDGGKAFRECSFTAFTQDRVNRRALTDALDGMAGRRAETKLTSIEDGNAMGWVWRDGAGRRVAVYSVADGRTPHQITLSIQSEDSN
jgi:hypothetical protein